MRLDKWLKVARVVRRRTLAHDAADTGRVLQNGRVAKPASEVRVGDELTLDLGGRITRIAVREVPERANVRDPESLYEVISVERKEN